MQISSTSQQKPEITQPEHSSRVNRSLSLDPTPSHLYPVHTLTLQFFKTSSHIIFPLLSKSFRWSLYISKINFYMHFSSFLHRVLCPTQQALPFHILQVSAQRFSSDMVNNLLVTIQISCAFQVQTKQWTNIQNMTNLITHQNNFHKCQCCVHEYFELLF